MAAHRKIRRSPPIASVPRQEVAPTQDDQPGVAGLRDKGTLQQAQSNTDVSGLVDSTRGRHNEVVMFDSTRGVCPHEIIFSQRRRPRKRKGQRSDHQARGIFGLDRRCCCCVANFCSELSPLGERVTQRSGQKAHCRGRNEEMQGRGTARCRHKAGKRQTQAGLPRTACRRHAGKRWRRIIVACRQGRGLSGKTGQSIERPSDKSGRTSK